MKLPHFAPLLGYVTIEKLHFNILNAVFPTVLTIFLLNSRMYDFEGRRAMAVYIANNVIENETFISDMKTFLKDFNYDR